MAVVKMQKVRIIGLKQDKEKIIEQLQEIEFIHLKDFQQGKLDEYFSADIFDEKGKHIVEELSHIESTISYIEQFDENKSIIENFFPVKVEAGEKEFEKTVKKFNYKKIVTDIKHIKEKFAKIDEEIASLHSDISLLVPFQNLSWVPAKKEETKTTDSAFLKGEKEKYIVLVDKFGELGATHLEIISEDEIFVYLFLIYCKEDKENISSILKEEGFENANLSFCDKLPSEALLRSKNRIDSLLKQREKLAAKIKKQILSYKDQLMMTHDWCLFKLQRARAQTHLRESKSAFILQGWVREDQIESSKKVIKDRFPATYIENVTPDEGEMPPIATKNHPIIRPFQSVTNLFGFPQIGEVDPAGLVAPFFFIFFGLCLADVGYGVALIVLILLAMRKITVTKSGKQFFYLFLICGFSSIMWGLITGGWFGIDISNLPPVLRKMILFDPLKDVMALFVLALCFGVIQVFFGMFVGMYEKLRTKNFAAAFADHFSFILIVAGIILWTAATQKFLSEQFNTTGLLIISAGFITMVLASLFRKGKNPLIWLLIGLGGIAWKAKDFIGNVLSYSRLMALGLAGYVIALVINTTAGMLFAVPANFKYLGILGAVIILIGGHTFNLAINTLGAFVHTTRLQFVEFFSYFFQGGGEAFQPLSRESKYVVSKD